MIAFKFYSRKDIRFCKSSFCHSNHSSIFIYTISDSIGNYLSAIVIREVLPSIRLSVGCNACHWHFYAWRNFDVKSIVAKRRRHYGVANDWLKIVVIAECLIANWFDCWRKCQILQWITFKSIVVNRLHSFLYNQVCQTAIVECIAFYRFDFCRNIYAFQRLIATECVDSYFLQRFRQCQRIKIARLESTFSNSRYSLWYCHAFQRWAFVEATTWYCCYPRWNLDCFQQFARIESIAAQSCQRLGQRYWLKILTSFECIVVYTYNAFRHRNACHGTTLECVFSDFCHRIFRAVVGDSFWNRDWTGVGIVISVGIRHFNRVVASDIVVDTSRLKVVGGGWEWGGYCRCEQQEPETSLFKHSFFVVYWFVFC